MDDVDWKPKVKMTMSSKTANKSFQGKENVAVDAQYRDLVEAEYPHLNA